MERAAVMTGKTALGKMRSVVRLVPSVQRSLSSASAMPAAAVETPQEERDEDAKRVNGVGSFQRREQRLAPQASPEIKRADTFPMWLGLDVQPREYQILTKSRIREVFEARTTPGALDPRPYIAAASVLPMRTNNYVVEDLIDWQNVPNDPMFQLVFPQPGMLSPHDLQRSMDIIEQGVTGPQLREEMEAIRAGLNPHPAGQKTLNVPSQAGTQVKGMQHKYRETVLFFPTEAQYCHSFCTYCFRWAQFTAVGSAQQFASKDSDQLRAYLREHRDISDVLFTGGDPMVMNAKQLSAYVDPILRDPTLDHIATIRFGTKAVAYWPYRFVTDPDADETLRLFQRVVESGRQVSIMAHFSHPNELAGPVPQEAIRRIRSTGANVRTQAPLINHVNADPATWASMWRLQTRLGAIPYYMFVERDTGARRYFEVPLAKAYEIFIEANMATSGTVRTVRGPSMSATPGKVQVVGVSHVAGEKVFVLRFLQARNPEWCRDIFFAKYDEKAMWLDDLRPAFGKEKFFYEDEFATLESASAENLVSSGQVFPLRGPVDDTSGLLGGLDSPDSGLGRGMCVGGGSGDLRYTNHVIPPAPLGGPGSPVFQEQ